MHSEDDEPVWQRLAPPALAFRVVTGVQRFVRENLFLFAGAGAGAAFSDWMGPRELMLVGLVVVLGVLVTALVQHRRFRFRLEDDAVRVRQGLFQRTELRAQFDRVQNVRLSQPFYFRPFDLVRFSLETPGAATAEVELPGIPRPLAEIMRDRVLAQLQSGDGEEAGAETDEAPTSGPLILMRVPTAALLRHGMSSNQLWILAAALFYVLDLILRRYETEPAVESAVAWLRDQTAGGWLLPSVLALAVVGFLFATSGLLALVRFRDYRLLDHGDRVVAHFGRVDRQERTLRRARITGLSLRQSPVGRLLDCWQLTARQTRSEDPGQIDGGSTFLVPGLRWRDLQLTAALLRDARIPQRMTAIDAGFRRILQQRLVLVWLLLMIAVVSTPDRGADLWMPMGVLLVAALALIHLRWRHWGWHLDGKLLWIRLGLFGRRFEGIELERVQQASLLESPWQRRHGLRTLELILPQGALTIPYLPAETAAGLANRALQAAEGIAPRVAEGGCSEDLGSMQPGVQHVRG